MSQIFLGKHLFLGAVVTGASVMGAASISSAATALIDFGGTEFQTSSSDDALGRTWNNVGITIDGSTGTHNLSDTSNLATGWTLGISNPAGNDSTPSQHGFTDTNRDGTPLPIGDALARGYPVSATRDSGYGNTSPFPDANHTTPAVLLTLSNLSAADTYDLYFFASRMGVSDNRETSYQIVGSTTSTVYLNVAGNTGNIASASSIAPDANNQINITVSAGPNNVNAYKFYYLGVLEIASVPEPASMSVLGLGALALLRRHRKA